ncbi:putative membrane protein [Thioflavicoccus mobilis 8321]|uniref:Putative membrane protein n=1 Tax=Thioflavicoccus mobilis 8321 TaxID=765912 RepID=L0GYR1_9GAMM|nr:PepSY domain-containing protein [Thioflavicoccus mobilis]AGA90500.1 putative membrane protein [Thioflavicoccus mobilis 8321]
MPNRHGHRLIAVLLAAAVTVAAADDHDDDYYGRHDHDRARHALELGEIRPLAEILKRVSVEVPGEVVGVELERWGRRRHHRWAYELAIIAPDGRIREVYVDAATGEILEEDD